ncbi:START domain-containing protein [Ferrimonas marina]|uniref:START domain-containing protein n=1 Tax=Ferrimonas marina TaxID=299255 RepID=A0A1M5NT17_9GAMM|nr:START domain-containing protein [Ferrimonas marina]SHG92706.1 START domain-containing protein [Ferrimonas marina]
MKHATVIVLLLAMMTPSLASGEPLESGWHKARERKGIQVYRRPAADSAFKEFLAVAVLPASVDQVLTVLQDVEIGVEWVENVEQMQLVEQLDTNRSITYTYSEAPWPVSDRDAVVLNHYKVDATSGVVRLEQQGVPDALPEVAGAVRVPRLESLWVLTPLGPEQTQVRYQVLTDPGGHLPAWLINQVTVSQPYRTLLGLRSQLTR